MFNYKRHVTIDSKSIKDLNNKMVIMSMPDETNPGGINFIKDESGKFISFHWDKELMAYLVVVPKIHKGRDAKITIYYN